MNTLSLTRGSKQDFRTRIRGRNETRTGDKREVRLMDKQCEQPVETGMVRKGFLPRSSRKYANQLFLFCLFWPPEKTFVLHEVTKVYNGLL